MESIVWNVLKQDYENREKALQNDLSCKLFSITNVKKANWDYSLPTFLHQYSYNRVSRCINTLPQFNILFDKKIPFRIPMDNILFAGGCIADILTYKNSINDVDIFIYGLSSQEAKQRIYKLVNDLYISYKKYLHLSVCKKNLIEMKKEKDTNEKKIDKCTICNKTYDQFIDFKYIQNNNCITIILNERYTFQIILRVYKSIAEVLYGFDIGASAVGFDGNNVYYTHLSKFAYEYFCNIIDTTRRSTTYEARLYKYLNKGFEIILPHLNIQKLSKKNIKYNLYDVCELPYLVFSYSSIVGNKIRLYNFHNINNYHDYQIKKMNNSEILYHNLRNIVKNKMHLYFYTENINDLPLTKPYLSRRSVINFYDKLFSKILDKKILNIAMLKRYIQNTDNIFQALINENTIKTKCSQVLETCIREEKDRILLLVDNILAQDYPLQLIIDNPGAQLTASFNPIIEDESKWYGDYYLPR